MARSSTISSKGQITIPLEVRERLGVAAGDKVEFVEEDGLTVLRPVKPDANPFEKYVGILPAFKSRQELVDYWRELRGHEDGEEDVTAAAS